MCSEHLGLWEHLALNDWLLTESFSAADTTTSYSNLNKHIKQEKYLLLFFDLVNSTARIDDPNFIREVFSFLGSVLSEAQARFDGNFIFKLVGDGVLILVPYSFYLDDFLNEIFKKEFTKSIPLSFWNKNGFINKLYKVLKEQNNFNFRLVAGYGTLYCISFRTANGTLKECIGKPISFLVKVSKFVNTYKWFGNLD
jgi:hypothetical protein